MQRRRRWSNRNASSFPQLTHSHAARLHSGSHKAHPPVDLTRDLGVVDGAALSGTRTTQALERAVAAGREGCRAPRVGVVGMGSPRAHQGLRKGIERTPPLGLPVIGACLWRPSGGRCHMWKPLRELGKLQYKRTPSADWLTVRVGAPTCSSSRRCRPAQPMKLRSGCQSSYRCGKLNDRRRACQPAGRHQRQG